VQPTTFSWWAVLPPAILIGSFEFLRHSLLENILPRMAGNLVAAFLVGIAAAVYVSWAAKYIRLAERSLGTAREETAVLQERDRIARDMHDNVSQALFYMGVHLGDIQSNLETGDQEKARQSLDEVRGNLVHTYERVRSTIADLREHPATPHTLAGALVMLRTSLERQFDLRVNLHEPIPEVLLPEIRLKHLMGICQESLVNTAKHSGVHEASVMVKQGTNRLEIVVADEGRGFDPANRSAGFGLLMVQERAELMGARLTIDAHLGQGARIRLDVPLEGEEA
jgi:signal transduction histidine kinase